jgi:hypothetical protein
LPRTGQIAQGFTVVHLLQKAGCGPLENERVIMSEAQNDQERPCLHCMMVELIDDFFAEYLTPPGVSDKVDTGEADELIEALAKVTAELTSRQHGTIRQQIIEQLMQEIMKYDGEFRREDTEMVVGSQARH